MVSHIVAAVRPSGWVGVAAFVMLLCPGTTALAAAPGGIAQLAAPNGCISDDGSGGSCAVGHDFARGLGVVASPDGRNVYMTAVGTNAVLTFDRDQATGVLTQKQDELGCVHSDVASATCAAGHDFVTPSGVAITPNGKTVFVASESSNSVTVFAREPSTGVLTQEPGTAGCIAKTASATCTGGRALGGAFALWLSPDAKFLYVGSADPGGMTVLAVADDGSLSQVTDGVDDYGCVQDTPDFDSCGDGRAMGGVASITGSPDGQSVYVGSIASGSVVGFSRDQSTGRVTPLAGSNGCADQTGSEGCATVADLGQVRDVAVSPDSQDVYVASPSTGTVVLFDRLSNGLLVRRLGADGCLAPAATADCRADRGLSQPQQLVVTPDGGDVYVTSLGAGSGVAELDRAANGVLSPRPGTRGCIVAGSAADCASFTGFDNGAYALALTPDTRNLYFSNFTSPELGAIRRDSAGPVCSDASATVQQGTATTLTIPCSDADGDTVATEIVTPPTLGALGALDQARETVNYAAPQGQCGSTTFEYHGTSSGITTPAAVFSLTVEGCAVTPVPTPPGDNAACVKDKKKLEKAKAKLKKLRKEDAKPAAIKRAKEKLKNAKRAVKRDCA